MDLSKIHHDTEKLWFDEERRRADELVTYLDSHLDVDLSETAHTQDSLEIILTLNVWLFGLHHDIYLEALRHLGYSLEEYYQNLIYSFMLSVSRQKPNVDFLYKIFTQHDLIDKLFEAPGGQYLLVTKDFGEIPFITADTFIASNPKLKEYVQHLGGELIDGCHEVSFFLIQQDPELKAVTAICRKFLSRKFYHSFALDSDDNVIDLTASLILPKPQYYMLNHVEELHITDYQTCLHDNKLTSKFDSSGTLFDLLRQCPLLSK